MALSNGLRLLSRVTRVGLDPISLTDLSNGLRLLSRVTRVGLDPISLTDLGHRFEQLVARVFGSSQMAGPWFEVLTGLYVEPAPSRRRYHTMRHIDALLGALDAWGDLPANVDKDVAELAIWFHDAIYVPGAKDNEDRSAELFWAFANTLGRQLDDEQTHQVVEIIRATTHRADPLPMRTGCPPRRSAWCWTST